MQRTGKSFHHRGTLALPPAQQPQVTAGHSLLSYLRVDAARCDHRKRRFAQGTVAYRRALPAWHHEEPAVVDDKGYDQAGSQDFCSTHIASGAT